MGNLLSDDGAATTPIVTKLPSIGTGEKVAITRNLKNALSNNPAWNTKMNRLFDAMDLNRDGTLDLPELKAFLIKTIPDSKPAVARTSRKIMTRFDLDGNKRISKYEFHRGLDILAGEHEDDIKKTIDDYIVKASKAKKVAEEGSSAPAKTASFPIIGSQKDGSDEVVQRASLPDGKVVTLFKNGRKVQVDPDGCVSELLPDGTITKTNNGVELTLRPDGTKFQRNANGDTLEVLADGTQHQTRNNGAFEIWINSDGSYTQVDKNKNITLRVSHDGVKTETHHDSGLVVKCDQDDTKVATYEDGCVVTVYGNGMREQIQPDGEFILQMFPDGHRIQANRDGSTIQEFPDGSKIEKHPDGQVLQSDSPKDNTKTNSKWLTTLASLGIADKRMALELNGFVDLAVLQKATKEELEQVPELDDPEVGRVLEWAEKNPQQQPESPQEIHREVKFSGLTQPADFLPQPIRAAGSSGSPTLRKKRNSSLKEAMEDKFERYDSSFRISSMNSMGSYLKEAEAAQEQHLNHLNKLDINTTVATRVPIRRALPVPSARTVDDPNAQSEGDPISALRRALPVQTARDDQVDEIMHSLDIEKANLTTPKSSRSGSTRRERLGTVQATFNPKVSILSNRADRRDTEAAVIVAPKPSILPIRGGRRETEAASIVAPKPSMLPERGGRAETIHTVMISKDVPPSAITVRGGRRDTETASIAVPRPSTLPKRGGRVETMQTLFEGDPRRRGGRRETEAAIIASPKSSTFPMRGGRQNLDQALMSTEKRSILQRGRRETQQAAIPVPKPSLLPTRGGRPEMLQTIMSTSSKPEILSKQPELKDVLEANSFPTQLQLTSIPNRSEQRSIMDAMDENLEFATLMQDADPASVGSNDDENGQSKPLSDKPRLSTTDTRQFTIRAPMVSPIIPPADLLENGESPVNLSPSDSSLVDHFPESPKHTSKTQKKKKKKRKKREKKRKKDMRRVGQHPSDSSIGSSSIGSIGEPPPPMPIAVAQHLAGHFDRPPSRQTGRRNNLKPITGSTRLATLAPLPNRPGRLPKDFGSEDEKEEAPVSPSSNTPSSLAAIPPALSNTNASNNTEEDLSSIRGLYHANNPFTKIEEEERKRSARLQRERQKRLLQTIEHGKNTSSGLEHSARLGRGGRKSPKHLHSPKNSMRGSQSVLTSPHQVMKEHENVVHVVQDRHHLNHIDHQHNNHTAGSSLGSSLFAKAFPEGDQDALEPYGSDESKSRSLPLAAQSTPGVDMTGLTQLRTRTSPSLTPNLSANLAPNWRPRMLESNPSQLRPLRATMSSPPSPHAASESSASQLRPMTRFKSSPPEVTSAVIK